MNSINKGVYKRVIEVTETGSDYFERAIFIVSPEKALESEFLLKTQASMFIKKQVTQKEEYPLKTKIFGTILKLSIAAAAGASLAILVIKL